MRNKTTTSTKPLSLNYEGTPITDETFERQGWVKLEGQDDMFDEDDWDDGSDDFDIEFTPDEGVFEDFDGEFFDEFDDGYDIEPKYPNQGDWEEEYYFWILKIPKDFPDDDILTFISTTSDHHIPGLKKGEYLVELYNERGLGICSTEEQIEVLYKALCGESIYDGV